MLHRRVADKVLIGAEHSGAWRQIWNMTTMELRKSHRGSLLGWLWLIVWPLILLGLYWFIIAIGLHSNTIKGEAYHYLPWLVVGLWAWFFVSDMITAGVGAFRKYKFLITKSQFPVATIPTIVTNTKLIIHLILALPVLTYLYAGGYFAPQWLQLPLYVGLSATFAWFWSLFAAPLGAISKDFTQLVKSCTRVLVWVSGILWSIQNIHIFWLREIMEFNPIYFIAEGYRKSLIYHQWFFEDMQGLLIFAGELMIMAMIAVVIYGRTRKEMADIL